LWPFDAVTQKQRIEWNNARQTRIFKTRRAKQRRRRPAGWQDELTTSSMSTWSSTISERTAIHWSSKVPRLPALRLLFNFALGRVHLRQRSRLRHSGYFSPASWMLVFPSWFATCPVLLSVFSGAVVIHDTSTTIQGRDKLQLSIDTATEFTVGIVSLTGLMLLFDFTLFAQVSAQQEQSIRTFWAKKVSDCPIAISMNVVMLILFL
jgi:hypothetical protein